MRISDWSSDVCSSDLHDFRMKQRFVFDHLMPPSEPERWFESSNGAAGYADYVPKEEFFRELHNSFLDSRDTFETKCLQQTDGQILSIDASHKVTNLVYV